MTLPQLISTKIPNLSLLQDSCKPVLCPRASLFFDDIMQHNKCSTIYQQPSKNHTQTKKQRSNSITKHRLCVFAIKAWFKRYGIMCISRQRVRPYLVFVTSYSLKLRFLTSRSRHVRSWSIRIYVRTYVYAYNNSQVRDHAYKYVLLIARAR